MKKQFTFAALLTAQLSLAAPRYVLSDIQRLKTAKVNILAQDPNIGVGLAIVTPMQEAMLSQLAHKAGRCGGYELVPTPQAGFASPQSMNQFFDTLVKDIRIQKQQSASFARRFVGFPRSKAIEDAVAKVSADNIKSTVQFMSSFQNRHARGQDANKAVVALKQRIETIAKAARVNWNIDLLPHNSVPQQSIRVHIQGKSRPQEMVIIGGHLDSINQSGINAMHAPGADDNASGTSTVIEAFRVLSQLPQPERSIEFMLYAGEELGLLGSAEIAKDYKARKFDVIGVMQLDMTMHPGSGEFVMATMTDFTSPWLRNYIAELNKMYVGGKIIEDRCGYGCSDHASWHRQGFPAVMPFEASFHDMNHNIHTSRDVINEKSSFKHAAMFGKLAVAFAMQLANSTDRENPGFRR